jgi:hypothetical protein
MSAIATVNDEYDKLADLVRNLGGSFASPPSSSSSSSFSSVTPAATNNNINFSSFSSVDTVQLLQLQKENTRLKEENKSLRNLVQDHNHNSNDIESTLRDQILQLSSELASERSNNMHTDTNETNSKNEIVRLQAQIAKLEKRNARDHQKMRTLRNELLSQSKEADFLARQNDSFLRQSRLSTSLGHSGGVSTKTEDRLEILAHEYSELQRGGDDLMLSSISGIQSQDESSLYQTAIPYNRRQSVNIDLGNGTNVIQHRNGSVDMHFGKETKNGIRSSRINGRDGGGGDLGVDELQ